MNQGVTGYGRDTRFPHSQIAFLGTGVSYPKTSPCQEGHKCHHCNYRYLLGSYTTNIYTVTECNLVDNEVSERRSLETTSRTGVSS